MRYFIVSLLTGLLFGCNGNTPAAPSAPADLLIYASYASGLNADYSKAGSVSATALASAVASSGMAQLIGASKGLWYSATSNDPGGTGTVRFTVVPQYSGSPADWQVLLAMSDNSAPGTVNSAALEIMHRPSDGNIYLGAAGIDGGLGAWSPTSGVSYEFELNFTQAGTAYLFINGTLFWSGAWGNRGGATKITLGQQGGSSFTSWSANFKLDNFMIFNTVKHTANYTAPSAAPM